MSHAKKWWLGIIILAIVATLMSLFGPYSANKNSKEMGQTIKSALNSAGHNDVAVKMSGNVAKLSGMVKSESAKASALNVAKTTTCKTCASGKEKIWHEAKDDGIEVEKAAIISPYTFSAVKAASGGVVLDGFLRNEDEIQSVLAQAQQLFPGGVTNRTLRAASGEPNARWRDVAGANLTNLAKLSSGRATMTDVVSTLTGEAQSRAIYDQVTSEYASAIPRPYEAKPNIQAPNIQPAPAQEITSLEVCQMLFDDLKGDNRINFASGKAEIRPGESLGLLNKLSKAAQQCASFQISVEGHTDWEGDSDYNQWLSEGRAKAVVAYLADNGVEISRMRAIGFGESRPIATNETREGMARNRRIEFKVTRSE